ncbi:MAG: NADH-quinone oxidoreductase subunit D [Chloroflexi bacterium]|nr:NADH-quinone oxidoreductase subunit D [Chloroflexota bacterium]
MTLNMGPQHPSTHGVFRLILQLDGETIVGVTPVMGYLHRSTEKLGEARTYVQGVTLTDRMDYLSPMTTNWAYALSIERLAGLEVPERAEYIRIIVGELSRIQSHQVAIGTFGADVGTWFTPLVYCFRERELILDLFMQCAGVRMNPSYIRFGGVARDVSDEFLERCQAFVDLMPAKIDEYESLLTTNEIFIARTRGVGLLPPELCKQYSVTGPIARASGIPYDVRRAEPYGIYDRFDWEVPVLYGGDAYSRYLIRIAEMRESVKIIRQALRDIPAGDIRGRMPKTLRPPKGDAYARVEGPKGEIGFFLVSDGSTSPYRYKVRAPSFINLTVLSDLTIGHKIADAVVILGSFDIVMGEVDR